MSKGLTLLRYTSVTVYSEATLDLKPLNPHLFHRYAFFPGFGFFQHILAYLFAHYRAVFES